MRKQKVTAWGPWPSLKAMTEWQGEGQTSSSTVTTPIAALAFFLVISLVVRVLPVLHPLEVIDNQTLVDDTYLSLEIAKNIGMGKGPLYKDDYTSGYQPLYVLLAAPLFTGFDDTNATVDQLDQKVRQALGILILFDLGSLLILAKLLAKQFGWRTPTLIGMILWALHPMIIKNSLNGMETSISIFFLLATFYFFQHISRRSQDLKIRFLFGLVIGLAVLARIDLAILGFWILVTELNDVRLKRWTFMQAATSLIVTFLGFLVSYLPWLLWSYSYTGDLFPVSGSGVRFQSLILLNAHNDTQPVLWSMVSVLATILYPAYKSPLLYLIALGLLIFAFVKRKNQNHWMYGFSSYFKPWAILLAFCITLIFSYGLYIMGWWFYDRYLFCLIFIPIVAIVATADLYLKKTQNPNAARNLIFLVLAVCLIQPRFWTMELGINNEKYQGYRSLGIWLNETLPKGSTVGSMQTGGLGFYGTNLRVINLDGVVNKAALDALKAGQIEQYIKNEGLDYIVGWDVNTLALVRTSKLGEAFKEKLVFVEKSDFISWHWSAWDLYKVEL